MDCQITKCKNAIRYKCSQLCGKHYQQIRKHGKTHSTIRDRRRAIIKKDIALLPIGVNAKDGYAIVDKEYSYLEKHNWSLSSGYPQTNAVIDGKKTVVRLYYMILKKEHGKVVDHINGNKLDNTTVNLRKCSDRENLLNRKTNKNNRLGIKGVEKHQGKYRARISFASIRYNLGCYSTAEEAADAYKKAAIKIHGEFARVA